MASKIDLTDTLSQREESEYAESREPMKPAPFKKCVTAKHSSGVSQSSSWRLEAGTLLEIRASHLLKLVCLLIVALVIVTITFHSRIRALESQKNTLQNDLSEVKALIQRMESVISRATLSDGSSKVEEEDYGLSYDDEEEASSEGTTVSYDNADSSPASGGQGKILVKRSASGRTTKDLHYQASTIKFNSLSNDTSFDSLADGWTAAGAGVAVAEEVLKSRKGKNAMRKKLVRRKYIRRLVHREVRKLKVANRLEINNFKRHLCQTQPQLQSAQISRCNNDSSSSPHKNSNVPADAVDTAFGKKRNCRAVYLQIDGSSVNIKNPKQRIGPWYLPAVGNEIGFNDMWYNNLSLDSNGTTITFQEDGLFLIYAQIFYQLQHLPGSKPSPMGYRIYLKKNSSSSHYRRPVPIAECVPSFPSTFYQTCFTQVAWFVEANDEIYLEHFMDSLPIIDALRSGQTFLGIVRL